jgi:hypothetical protein
LFPELSRWFVVGLLLAALVAAPAVALCGDCAGKACCCSKQGNCHKPFRQDAPRAKCCDSRSTPAPVAGATAQADTLPSVDAPECRSFIVVTDCADHVVEREARDLGPPPATLYTLHSAFLI